MSYLPHSDFFNKHVEFSKAGFVGRGPGLNHMLKTSVNAAAELELILAPYEKRLNNAASGFLLIEAIVYIADGLGGTSPYDVTDEQWRALAPLAAEALDFAINSPDSFVLSYYRKRSAFRNRLDDLQKLIPVTQLVTAN